MRNADAIQVLARASRVVAVGPATEPGSPSFNELKFLAVQGWDVVAVDPHREGRGDGDTVQVLFGQRTHATLDEVPVPLEVVAIYAGGDDAVEPARRALEAGARALWFPGTTAPEEVHRIAGDADVPVVEDVLLMEAHTALYGSGRVGQRRQEGTVLGSPTRLALAPGWNPTREPPGTE